MAATPRTAAVWDRPALEAAYQECVRRAEDLAGTSVDAVKRAEHYFALYEASAGNFLFPLVATHGSLWGVTHTLRIERWLERIERLSRSSRVSRWIGALDSVRDINRRVFVEVHSTFHFTREHGEHPDAVRFVKAPVLALYNRVHEAVRRGQPLPAMQRRAIYYEIFVHEQIDIVDPGIQDAVVACGTPALVAMLKYVRPRFRYFPPGQRLYFTDFTSVDQRNEQGLRAHDFAVEVGPERVREAMAEYPL